MNREIKFRAWDEEEKEMCYDFLAKNWMEVAIKSPFVNIMQFTGLHDRNGVPIYEGDFVKNENTLGEIKYVPEHAAFMVLEEIGYSFIEARNAPQTNYEIIGNIYENENLLK